MKRRIHEEIELKGTGRTRRSGDLQSMLLLLLTLAILLAGCASVTTPKDGTDSLRATAEKYWKMRMSDQYENAYKFEDKTGVLPFESYKERAMAIKKIPISSYSIGEVNVSGGSGTVNVECVISFPNTPVLLHDTMKDQWVFKDGSWRHILPE